MGYVQDMLRTTQVPQESMQLLNTATVRLYININIIYLLILWLTLYTELTFLRRPISITHCSDCSLFVTDNIISSPIERRNLPQHRAVLVPDIW